MGAAELARALGGTRAGDRWMAHCPAHEDRSPSLSISTEENGRVLVHCHAGCDQASVIAALRSRGLWGRGSERRLRGPRKETRLDDKSSINKAKRTEYALRIWNASRPPAGTPVEAYLCSRGLRDPLPKTVRFHPALKHRSGSHWPAMVALVTDGTGDTPLAIHRTFLARDGAGKAPVEPAKMMLGPCRGGAVRLGYSEGKLMVGEGIETCMAAMQATGLPAWAALSTSGLRALALPESIAGVIVLADGDDSGLAAARGAALRWKREGRRVRIAQPPSGMDFNDLLLSDQLVECEVA